MNESNSTNANQLLPMEVLSYGGTSQHTTGNPSACGLACVNATLLVLSLLDNPSNIQGALDTIRSREFVDKIMEICSFWAHRGHLDVDDILALPMFATTLGTCVAIKGNWSGPENFHAIHGFLPDDTPTVAIITRPPEIVTLFNIPSGDPDRPPIQVLFDSHPRPHLHPRGAAFIFFLNKEGPTKYLSSLFQLDKVPIESRICDASFLGQYTARVLKLKMSTQLEAERAFYQANIRILEGNINIRTAATAEIALSAEVASLKREIALQQQGMDRTMAASHEQMKLLRHEIDQLKRVTGHEQTGEPNRTPTATTTQHLLSPNPTRTTVTNATIVNSQGPTEHEVLYHFFQNLLAKGASASSTAGTG